jgi:HK97 family phage major capsid protein
VTTAHPRIVGALPGSADVQRDRMSGQATAGMGTDLLNSQYGSLAERYALSPACAFLLRNATWTAIKNLKTTAGDPVGSSFVASSPAPYLIDPFVSAMGANAESVVFGDWSRYVVRIAGGLRVERSDEYAWQPTSRHSGQSSAWMVRWWMRRR